MYAYRWFSPQGVQTVLVAKRGHKFMQLVTIEADGLRLAKAPLTDERFLIDKVKTTKTAWKRMGRKSGTTKGARKALKLALAA